jgi:hypothetical protein
MTVWSIAQNRYSKTGVAFEADSSATHKDHPVLWPYNKRHTLPRGPRQCRSRADILVLSAWRWVPVVEEERWRLRQAQ